MMTDLMLTRRALESLSDDRIAVDLQSASGDLRLASGRANLAQAILNRLFTRQGELTGLGHPDYGSRLYQLIGEPNIRRTHALADLYIRECLAQEERIEEVITIAMTPASLRPDLRASLRADPRSLLEIQITVRPIEALDATQLLTLSLKMNLEG
jgi:hypothetical protein